MNKASKRTINNLKGINHKLISLIGYTLAISKIDFFVNEGLRTTEKQQEYYKKGVSQLDGIKKKSNHQLGRAVDIYYVGWNNKDKSNDPRWEELIDSFRVAAKSLGIKVIFGYDWGWDKPHIELAKEE
ncbi:M15 family metallopeptidase [Fusobacterium ulcerans]|uniref:M15 family metallopeptidase n=1 Tax=Fusobacterium ulcerans TaxID=861 RepID=UPI0027BABDC0|nr:M15 family metallopeptidase [Fusobacterium ulcerans]